MKHLLLLLVLLAPNVLFAQQFKYNKVQVLQEGSDNFNMDRARVRAAAGNIILKDNIIKIDKTKYVLGEETSPNVYKSKNCAIKLVYWAGTGNLAYVKLYKYNQVYNYQIVE